jgi:hypothetical protein
VILSLKTLEWVRELGVDKVIRRANRILKEWGMPAVHIIPFVKF